MVVSSRGLMDRPGQTSGHGGADIDVLHLTFLPPAAPGSYNRFVGVQLKELTEFRQAVISYGDSRLGTTGDPRAILVDVHGLSIAHRALLLLPERIRKLAFRGVGSRESLIYLWQILRLLPLLKPKLIVCYDSYKFGFFLRSAVTWPARVVLSQHGHSYFLPPATGTRVYQLESFDAVVTLTESSYRFDRRRLPAYEPQVAIIPNGVDTDRFSPAPVDQKARLRSMWDLGADKLVVLLLGRLVPKKGAHVMIQSWPGILRDIPEAVLWIVGDGDPNYKRYLERLVHSLGIAASVRLQGFVSPENTPTCYQASDLYVFPVLCAEGQGLSLLEAMSSGLACVVSDQPFVTELYGDQTLAMVGNPNVEDSFVGPVVKALSDRPARERMGRAARCKVEERFTQTRALDALEQFYRRQLCSLGRRR
jgi:glycosyltransferase involved in cell wall biosynthesis